MRYESLFERKLTFSLNTDARQSEVVTEGNDLAAFVSLRCKRLSVDVPFNAVFIASCPVFRVITSPKIAASLTFSSSVRFRMEI